MTSVIVLFSHGWRGMQILDNRALLFTTRKADQIVQLIPKARIMERRGDLSRILVNWGVDEVRVLRNLRIKDVPHPIIGRYDWPGVYKPFDHQRETAAFLATHPRCFVLSEAGTGKTSAAAWAADYLMTKGKVSRVLVVCPVSIMESAWRSDLFKTVMHRSVALATGSRKKRIEAIESDAEFVIINFDGVKVVQKELMAGGFDLVIVDEATAIKTVTTDRWRMLATLITARTRVWLMTGTPAAQSPIDAYGLAKMVNPASVPRSITGFRDLTMLKVHTYKWVPRREAQDIVHKVLQPAIRFTKEQCLDLPDMLYQTRDIELTNQQKHYYNEIRTRMRTMAAGEQITVANAAGMLNKLLQISSGAAYTIDREVVEFDISNKFDELMSIIDGTPRKVIVFVPFRHAIQMIEDRLNKEGISCAAIHGEVSAGQRGEFIKSFQTADDPRVMLIVPQAAAHGVTLTRADTVVWWGPVPSAELYLQGNARAHRAGQTNKVTVVRLRSSPVERRIYNLLDNKVDVHESLVELFQQEIA
jgi:SNF2 family DNA or RNA helicase